LRLVLKHLEDAGANLDELEISPERYRATFPTGYRPVWNVAATAPVTATHLLDMYVTHRRLLAEPVATLTDAGLDDFVLVSGRAYQARYPHYSSRAEFDTDLVAGTIDAAMAAADALEETGFALDTVRIRRMGSNPDATVEIRREARGHRVWVGILVGGYHAHRGPILERAEVMDFLDRPVRVASAEDMLVMLAARVERKRAFARVNANDAAIIVSSSRGRLDWDYVERHASRARLGVTLLTILAEAERVAGEDLVPATVRSGLAGTALAMRFVSRRTAAAEMTLGQRSVSERAARRVWLADLRRRELGRSHSPARWSRPVLRIQRRILHRQLGTEPSGAAMRLLGRIGARLRTRTGAFCEVAPGIGVSTGCISWLAPWHGSAEAERLLAGCSHLLAAPPGPHRCSAMTFDLADRDGH
jgi:hypothetical protein